MANAATIRAIRDALLNQGVTYRQASARFGVPRSDIRRIMADTANDTPPKSRLPNRRMGRRDRDAAAAVTLALTENTCRWPEGEGRTMRYCGAPVKGGKKHAATHCDFHLSKLYQPKELTK